MVRWGTERRKEERKGGVRDRGKGEGLVRESKGRREEEEEG